MIRYEKYQSQREGNTNGKWYARATYDETLTLDELAEHMATHGTPYSEGTISGVLKDMVGCIRELVLDGKAVKIPDLAIFSLGIETTPAKTAKEWTPQDCIKRTYIKARGTGEFSSSAVRAKAKFKEAEEYGVDDPAESAAEQG